MKKSKHNLAGQKFGRLLVIERASKSVSGEIMWGCKCDCGKSHTASQSNLRGGNTRSCGCLRRETASRVSKQNHTTHGLTGTPEYDRARKNKRRERKRNLDSGWTHEMEQALVAFYPNCVLCNGNDRMTTDHVRPLSKGHGLAPGNAVRLCVSCNSIKQARDLDKLPDDMRVKLLEAARQFEKHYLLASRGCNWLPPGEAQPDETDSAPMPLRELVSMEA